MKYLPRRDWLVVRAEKAPLTRSGVAVPDSSAEGTRYVVVAEADVMNKLGGTMDKDLIGKTVIIGGPVYGDKNVFLLYQIPGESDLFHVRSDNMLSVVEG